MRKFFCLLLILLMFMTKCNVPVYAEDYETYTLETGKVYVFKRDAEGLRAEFSDPVLRGSVGQKSSYSDVSCYNYSNYVNANAYRYIFVYNVNNKDVTMTVTEGTIIEENVHDSVFSLVMYDGTETDFEMTNIGDGNASYRRFTYNEDNGSLTLNNWKQLQEGYSVKFTGKGIVFTKKFNVEERLLFDGVYEVSNYIRSDFFLIPPPWILQMDLMELLGAFWNQLLTLLPVGLLILSVFLLISFLIYTMRSFL